MQLNADITHFLITQFIGLVILSVVMILFILVIQKIANKLTNGIETQISELNSLNQQHADNQKVLVSVFTKLETLTSENSEINQKISSLQQELALLSSDYSDNQQISQAIELARKGSNTKMIVEQTGLSAEDADAIVRFHGKQNPT